MKTLASILILFLAWSAQAQMSLRSAHYAAALKITGETTPNAPRQNWFTNQGNSQFAIFSRYESNRMLGVYFFASNNYSMTRWEPPLYRIGASVGTVTASVWSDNSGSPGTQLAVANNTLDSSTLPTTGSNWISFNFTGTNLTSGSKYWLVLSNATVDATKYICWPYPLVATASAIKQSTNGETWFPYPTASRTCNYIVYGNP